MWWIRRFYNLPPTDERFLNLTSEQIELELENHLIDNPELRKEFYSDPYYEEAEQRAIKEDSKLLLPGDDIGGDETWEDIDIPDSN